MGGDHFTGGEKETMINREAVSDPLVRKACLRWGRGDERPSHQKKGGDSKGDRLEGEEAAKPHIDSEKPRTVEVVEVQGGSKADICLDMSPEIHSPLRGGIYALSFWEE